MCYICCCGNMYNLFCHYQVAHISKKLQKVFASELNPHKRYTNKLAECSVVTVCINNILLQS